MIVRYCRDSWLAVGCLSSVFAASCFTTHVCGPLPIYGVVMNCPGCMYTILYCLYHLMYMWCFFSLSCLSPLPSIVCAACLYFLLSIVLVAFTSCYLWCLSLLPVIYGACCLHFLLSMVLVVFTSCYLWRLSLLPVICDACLYFLLSVVLVTFYYLLLHFIITTVYDAHCLL